MVGEPIKLFAQQTRDKGYDGLTRALAAHLHRSAAAYLDVRYGAVLDRIESFVVAAAGAFAALETNALVQTAGAKVPIVQAETYTAEIRSGLKRLRNRLPAEVLDRLTADIDAVERATTPDAALERIRALEDGRGAQKS